MRYSLALFLLVGLAFPAFSQHRSDVIDLDNFNKKYLEALIKQGIDSIRVEHGLKRLMDDSILFEAADYHAAYLVEKDILSHFQEDRPHTRTPQDRAQWHGAVDYATGENVALTFLNKPTKNPKTGRKAVNNTYGELAYSFVYGWRHSPPHYANMITPDWEITGVAVEYNPETKEFKGVQKFAQVRGKYYYELNRPFFPYADYQMPPPISSFDELPDGLEAVKPPFKLKKALPEDQQCNTCNEVMGKLSSLELQPNGRNLILYSEEPELIAELVNNRKDGFAIELVYFTPVDCGNPAYYELPSRRNELSVINGELYEPHYKKVLKSGFKGTKFKWLSKIKKDEKTKYFKYKIAKLPKEFPDYYECNLAVIQKKRVCYIKHLASLCTDPNPAGVLTDLAPADLINDLPLVPERELIPDFTERDILFTVPFEQGRADYNYSDIKPMIDTLTFDKFDVFSIDIKAFTSLEGTEKINKALQLKRSNSIVKAVEKEQKKKIPATVESMPNWTVFAKQIEAENALKSLKGLEEAQILEKLKDIAFAKEIEPFLAKQRRADITMHIRTDVTEGNSNRYLVWQYEALVRDINRMFGKKGSNTKEVKDLVEELAELQNYIYYHVERKTLPDTMILHVKVPDGPLFTKLSLKQLWMEARHDSTYWEDEKRMWRLYNLLVNTAFADDAQPIDQYNFLVLYTRLFDQTKEKILPADAHAIAEKLDVSQLNGRVSEGQLDTLRLDLYSRLVHFYWPNHLDPKVEDRMNACLSYIFRYYKYKVKDLPDAEAFQVANFLSSYRDFADAMALIAPYAKKDKPHPGILVLMAKLSVTHPDEDPNSGYYNWVIDIAAKMPKADWCGMFIGACNISFQVFDHEPLYKKYCSYCK